MVASAISRLSQTLPHKQIGVCQGCGRGPGGSMLGVYREMDEFNRTSIYYLRLCDGCAVKHVKGHRLQYHRGPNQAITPGSMPVCQTCASRNGLACGSRVFSQNRLAFDPPAIGITIATGPNADEMRWAVPVGGGNVQRCNGWESSTKDEAKGTHVKTKQSGGGDAQEEADQAVEAGDDRRQGGSRSTEE